MSPLRRRNTGRRVNTPRLLQRYRPPVSVMKWGREVFGRTIHNRGFPLSVGPLEVIVIRGRVHVPHSQRNGLRVATSLTSVAPTVDRPGGLGSGGGSGPNRLQPVPIVIGGGGGFDHRQVRGLRTCSAAGVDGQVWG